MLGSSQPVSDVQRCSAHCGVALIVTCKGETRTNRISNRGIAKGGKKRNYGMKPRGYRAALACVSAGQRARVGRTMRRKKEGERRRREGGGQIVYHTCEWMEEGVEGMERRYRRWGRAGGDVSRERQHGRVRGKSKIAVSENL